jgi:outer membrane murein-binding lipoprotein Lpp
VGAILVAACALLGSSCRAAHINQLEQRVDKLETRVAVLESQMASQTHK